MDHKNVEKCDISNPRAVLIMVLIVTSTVTKDLDLNGDDDVRLPDGDSSFNLDNVEFADASDKEDLPDAMTAYEADRLLSSRLVNHVFLFVSIFQSNLVYCLSLECQYI